MNSKIEDAFDIHSESVLAIRRTVIIMSAILISLDYRYFSLPDSLSVFQVTITSITSWHIYATTIALLCYLLIKYVAKLREIYSKPNGNKIMRADYWIESEKSYWRKHFNSQLLLYLNKGQLGLEKVFPTYCPHIEHLGEMQRIEIKEAHNVQALKGGKYYAVGGGFIHCSRKNSLDHIMELVPWQTEIGPVSVSGWRRCLMITKAWFWYIFSDHFIIDYFPIIIASLALAKFGWLSYCRT